MQFYTPAVLVDGAYVLSVSDQANLADEQYALDAHKSKADLSELANEFIKVHFNAAGHVREVLFRKAADSDFQKHLRGGSFIPAIRYANGWHTPAKLNITVLQDGSGGVAQLRLQGEFDLPVPGCRPGNVDYRLTLIAGLPAIFAVGEIRYPETERHDLIKAAEPALARLIDQNWQEVAPLPLNMSARASDTSPFRVLKRNYFGVDSEYEVDYFQHSRQLKNLDNINNHITAGYVAVRGAASGVAAAMDTTRLANFAGIPLKMSSHGVGYQMRMNPFGTYHGNQYYQPTWGNRQGWYAAFLAGQQYKTAASTYNGYLSRLSVMVSFFDEQKLSAGLKASMQAFAYPAFTKGDGPARPGSFDGADPEAPRGLVALYGSENGVPGMFFHWELSRGDARAYVLRVGRSESELKHTFRVANDTSLHAPVLPDQSAWEPGQDYYVSIAAVGPDGRESAASAVTVFRPQEPPKKKGTNVPVWLQLKILLNVLESYID
ncbi:MAG: hypothetical protein KDK39_06910 [Leptospiraceae bacterium]|nr:hypothetical protein [Leptospiraceae bacterium]